ncbi:hypothetical protein [Rhizobium sp. PL01]|uniref:hypothetical protein n=1 Tax=Rhizobium sp. PL01 TaxID=3085631 RepID=UPI002981701E|nr:hypothetical protein [Rhizobium sp. PL01]MDW5313731.1 hypothetical protein [Rhizobium sp. PL01]
MKTFLDRLMRNAPGDPPAGGGGDLPAAIGATPPAATVPPVAAGNPPAPSAGDPPAVTPPPVAAGEIYKPEHLPDTMLGKSNKETLDNAAKALKGYRDRDAANNVPDTRDAYAEFAGDIAEPIKPHLETLKADPLFARVADKALAMKVPVPVYQGLVQEFLSVSQEMGLMEPIVDAAAEKAALLPETAKHLSAPEQTQAIEQRMNTNFAFLDAMVARGADKGGIAKDDADFAKAMLGDSAKGHRIFEWMAKTAAGGAGGGPAMQVNGVPHAADPKAELQARAALPQNTSGHQLFDRASWDQLQADYRRVHGN